jgi:endoglucanase
VKNKLFVALALVLGILCSINQMPDAQTQEDEFYIEALVANTSRSIVGINIVNNSDRTIENLSFNYYFTLYNTDVYDINPDTCTVEIITQEVPVSASTLIHIIEDAYYFKVTFQDGTDVSPGASAEVYFRFNQPIYTYNHYSNQGLNMSFKKTSYITLYDGETLVWGIEPALPDLTPTPPPVPSAPGDTNGDGSIDIIDALLVAQYYVGLAPAGFIYANADTNCSGDVDIVDALIIAQYYVGLVTQFCQ